MKMISIHEFKTSGLKRHFGSSKRVYRQCHIDKLLTMWKDLNYLSELSTRTKLVPYNEEFLNKKAIPHYNSTLKELQIKYPNIVEFQNYKLINIDKL